MNTPLTIEKTETHDDKCPNCGSDLFDIFHVVEWGRDYCEECLEKELMKFNIDQKF